MEPEIRLVTPHARRYELRDVPRVALDVPVFVHRRDGDAIVGRTRDVSASGVCVETPVPFDLDAATELTLELGKHPLRLRVDGAWQTAKGRHEPALSGLAFRHGGPDEAAALLQLVDETTQTLASFLCTVPAFHDFEVTDLVTLARATRYRNAAVGAPIQRAGTSDPESDAIYVVAFGEVELSVRASSGSSARRRILGPGDLFGGVALVGGVPILEAAHAESDVRLLELDPDAWRFLLTSAPHLAQALGFRVLHAAFGALASEPALI